MLGSSRQAVSTTPMDASMPRIFMDYGPLAEGDSRLISLFPGHWEDPIAFELVEFSTELGRLPFYEAVSYVWGDPDARTTATCSGRDIDITLSVEAFLRRFRLHDNQR